MFCVCAIEGSSVGNCKLLEHVFNVCQTVYTARHFSNDIRKKRLCQFNRHAAVMLKRNKNRHLSRPVDCASVMSYPFFFFLVLNFCGCKQNYQYNVVASCVN